jgi:HD-GYP domain-containing protein (c-di-GMP phosphodiesterase class II)
MQIMLEECDSHFDPAIFLQFIKVVCAKNEQLNSLVKRIKEDAKKSPGTHPKFMR